MGQVCVLVSVGRSPCLSVTCLSLSGPCCTQVFIMEVLESQNVLPIQVCVTNIHMCPPAHLPYISPPAYCYPSPHQVARILNGPTIVSKGPEDALCDGKNTIMCSTTSGAKRCGNQGDILAGAIATFMAWTCSFIEEARIKQVGGG